MKNKIYIIIFVFVLSLFASSTLAVSTSSVSIFEDGFEGGNFNNWTTVDKGADKWSVLPGVLIKAHSGKRDAEVSRILKKPSTDWKLSKATSTVGYNNINLSFYYMIPKPGDLESNDHIYVEYFDGLAWQKVGDITDTNTKKDWKLASYNLPTGANNIPSFAFRLRAQLSPAVRGVDVLDTFLLDDVKLSGQVIPAVVKYSITITQSPNGIITPTSTSVVSGQNQSFTITPNSGYKIENLIVDGSNVTATGTYEFDNVVATHTLSAVFGTLPQDLFVNNILGSLGSDDGKFNSPNDIAIDSNKNIYIFDGGNHRIQKFDSNGNLLLKWGSSGIGTGQFMSPAGIDIDSEDNVYVGDTGDYGSSRIQKFNSAGEYILSWGDVGTGPQVMTSVYSIDIDKQNGFIYTSSPNLTRGGFQAIRKFTLNGDFVSEWGGYGGCSVADNYYGYCVDPDGDGPLQVGDGQFMSPGNVAVDGIGNVYVTDPSNQRVQKFDSNGNLITKWNVFGSYGGNPERPASPYAVSVGDNGYVYITTIYGVDTVQVFTNNGILLNRWGYDSGVGIDQFNSPFGVEVVDNIIYVSDTGNSRIVRISQ